MFVRVILESAINESLFLLFLLRTLTPASTRKFCKSFFDLGTSFFFDNYSLYHSNRVANELAYFKWIRYSKHFKNRSSWMYNLRQLSFCEHCILADEPSFKKPQNLCISYNNLCGKIVSSSSSSSSSSSLETLNRFDEIFKVILVTYFILDFDFTLKQNKIMILSRFFLKNLRWFLLLLQ